MLSMWYGSLVPFEIRVLFGANMPVKSYKNLEFLNSPEARAIRILCEYEEPKRRFEQENVENTIVFFGSARARPLQDILEEKARLRKEAAASPAVREELEEQLEKLERVQRLSPYYEKTRELARKMTAWDLEQHTSSRFLVSTGGGPGIMEAGNKGAGRKESFSLNIKLPFEQQYNPYTAGDEKAVSFKYFFNRKLFFLKESDATVIFPGGFGTLDECFESLTLIQTGKTKPRPIILIDSPDSEYWKCLISFITEKLPERGFISNNDLSLLIRVNSIEQAVDEILQFYRVYHSIRYVGGKTVLRLNKPLSSEGINSLNEKYSCILRSGKIEPTDSLPAEQKSEEFLDLPRLVMDFNRHEFGKFHEMLRFLNTLGE